MKDFFVVCEGARSGGATPLRFFRCLTISRLTHTQTEISHENPSTRGAGTTHGAREEGIIPGIMQKAVSSYT